MSMNVKGSIFIDMVRLIKKDKSDIYNKYLTDSDRRIINQRIMPGGWYPYETYKHCIAAIFEVVAKNDLDVAKEWGRYACQSAMTTTYSGIVSGRDPLFFIKNYEVTNRMFYDFGRIETIVEGKNQAVYKLSGFDAEFVVFYYLIQGWMERGIELCGAKNIESEFITKSWEGQPFTSMRFTWTQ
jgi:hypothetical protein